jgi:hypothetical protein
MVGYQPCEGSKGLNALSPNAVTTIYKLLSWVEMNEDKISLNSLKESSTSFEHISSNVRLKCIL